MTEVHVDNRGKETSIQGTILIPAIQFDQYLCEAVASLSDFETYNLELIVIIDGAERKIPNWLCGRDSCRVFFTGNRKGAAAALNLGIGAARGSIIIRLDADDISLPGRLEKQLRYMRERPEVLLLGSSGTLIDGSGHQIGDMALYNRDSLKKDLLRRNPYIHSSVAIRKSVLTRLGGYDESCVRMQDYELFLRIALEGTIDLLPEKLVGYRVHANQSSKSLSGFIPLMVLLSRRKRVLAVSLNEPVSMQVLFDMAFSGAQLLRYLGIRKPRYLTGVGQ